MSVNRFSRDRGRRLSRTLDTRPRTLVVVVPALVFAWFLLSHVYKNPFALMFLPLVFVALAFAWHMMAPSNRHDPPSGPDQENGVPRVPVTPLISGEERKDFPTEARD